MTDDKSTLTRRRVLGGLATVGAAGAVGVGTWAEFSDEESADVTVSAGTLDLKVNGGDTSDGTTFELKKVTPGENGSQTISLENAGNITGVLTGDITDVTSSGSETSEPEKNVDPDNSGDLGQYLELKFSGTDALTNPTWDTLDWYVNHGPFTLDDNMKGDESDDLTIEWRVPSDVGNAIQGDTVTFHVTATLEQK